MRRVLARTRSEAPFLFAERGSLALTRALRRIGGGSAELTEDSEQSGLELHGTYTGTPLRDRFLSDCNADRGIFRGLELTGASWTRSSFRGARIEDTNLANSCWDVIDLEKATLHDLRGAGARFSLASFRDAELQKADLSGATFVLCDFSGARLADVNLTGARFVGCDFEGAHFEGVDASAADLRSCTFRGAHCAGLKLADAKLAGADFRHACALDEQQTAALKQAGARVGGAWLHRAWAGVLGRDGSAAAHRRTDRAVTGTWAFLAIALPVLFFGRAACDPVNPDYGPDVQAAEGDPDEE